MPRFKLQSGKTTVLKDLRAKAQKIEMESLKIQKAAIVQKKLLARIKDDAALDAISLQNMQNSQQKLVQMIQTLSNIMRTNHDTTKKIIQNMR